MLEEVKNVPQQPRVSGYRRWFADDEMELILWYGESGELTGFQLCYDVSRRERAFTWKRDHGLTHSAVDSGEDSPLHNRSPILRPDPKPPVEKVATEFQARSERLADSIIGFVLTAFATAR